MPDLIVVAVIAAFFGACVGLIHVCDHIIGPEEQTAPSIAESEQLAA